MNVSASLNVFKLIYKPSLCLPHATVSTFNDLPIPISKAFAKFNQGQDPDIRAVVLDKDDCFARPRENVIYKPYYVSQCSLDFEKLICSFSFDFSLVDQIWLPPCWNGSVLSSMKLRYNPG